MKSIIRLAVNNESHEILVDPSGTLLDLLRGPLGLTGSKEGCSNGNCGSCTVIMNKAPVCACLVLAGEADGATITSIEGVADGNVLHAVQQALIDHGGTQCGFCTPGIVLSAVALFDRNPEPSAAEIRHAIAGNLCRCTGYDKIVKAIESVAISANAGASR